MLTLVAFVLALGLLIAVHEYGHYRAAVACGVRVTRFSVGFGQPLLCCKPRLQRPGQDTEFVLGLLPLGGYVKMLGQGEAAPEDLKHLSFDAQPVKKRAFIVAAGPLANLALAVVLYASLNWLGSAHIRPIVAHPPASSLAERAGIVGAEEVVAAGHTPEALEPIRSLEELHWALTQAALRGQDLQLSVRAKSGENTRLVSLPISSLAVDEMSPSVFTQIGLAAPHTLPVMGELVPGGAGDRSGLKPGDQVLRIDGEALRDGAHLREVIRTSVTDGKGLERRWSILRGGQAIDLPVTVAVRAQGQAIVGKIQAQVGSAAQTVQLSHGLWGGFAEGLEKTWEVSALTLRMIGKMLVGEASVSNLSGPLTIAGAAGQAAQQGFSQYLLFLALISVSLGVLNLLPLPILDGGHLMYHAWELVVGRPVSLKWQEALHKAGLAALLALTALALFNDIGRFWV